MRIPIRPINKHFEQYLLAAAAQPKPTNTTGRMKTPGLLPEQHYPHHRENASQNISLFPPPFSLILLVQKYIQQLYFFENILQQGHVSPENDEAKIKICLFFSRLSKIL